MTFGFVDRALHQKPTMRYMESMKMPTVQQEQKAIGVKACPWQYQLPHRKQRTVITQNVNSAKGQAGANAKDRM